MPTRPNIVFIVLDSVRYDRTSMGPRGRETTPNMQSLATAPNGRSFDLAMAHGRNTAISSASMLTGKYPGEHRVGYESTVLDRSVPTVAEALRDDGYRTACVANNVLVSAETGLDRGFEDFSMLPNTPLGLLRTAGIGPTVRWLGNLRRHSAGFSLDKYRHSTGYLTTALARKKIDTFAAQSAPSFLYIHYNQTHRPYYPPLGWFDTYADEFSMSQAEAAEFTMAVHDNLIEKVANGLRFTDEEWTVLKALYDTQIKYTDELLGRLFRTIEDQFDDCIVVVTADHGEYFGERGSMAHKYVLSDAVLHVPLVTSGLEDITAEGPVQHSDVMRTLLETADVEAGFVDGIDLRTEKREYAVSQDSAISLETVYEQNPDFDPSQFFPGVTDRIPARTTLRTETHRYIQGEDSSELLFAIPDEETDIAEDRQELIGELRSDLAEWLKDRRGDSAGGTRVNGHEFAESTMEHLKKMGYIKDEF